MPMPPEKWQQVLFSGYVWGGGCPSYAVYFVVYATGIWWLFLIDGLKISPALFYRKLVRAMGHIYS